MFSFLVNIMKRTRPLTVQSNEGIGSFNKNYYGGIQSRHVECGDDDRKGKGVGGSDGEEEGGSVVCAGDEMEGDKAKELGGGCKLLRSGANKQGRNGVGIVISKDLKEDLISVSKRSDRVMIIKLGVEETVVNIICAYAPQVGCTEEEKETFWEQMDQELSATLDDERVIVGGDLNGHIGRSRVGIERIHGGWGMRDRNDEGEKIVDTAMAFDLAIVNTFFEKKVNQFVTYNSGGRESQIDFLM